MRIIGGVLDGVDINVAADMPSTWMVIEADGMTYTYLLIEKWAGSDRQLHYELKKTEPTPVIEREQDLS